MLTIKLTDELAARLVDIHRWQKTGVLEGTTLRKFAKTRARTNNLRQAENETFSEVAALVAAAVEG